MLHGGPIFDKEPKAADENLTTVTKLVLISSSTIFLNRSGKDLNTYCSSRGDRAELFHEDSGSLELSHIHGAATAPNMDMRSVFCGTVLADDGFTHHLWDPGSSEGSKSTRFGVVCDPAHRHDLHIEGFEYRFWDLAEASMHIVVATSCVDVGPNYFHWLILSLLTQQKCCGYFDSIQACPMLDDAQLQSLDRIHSLVGVHSTDICQLGAKWIVQFVDSALSSVCDCLGRDIEASSLVFKPLLVYMADGAQQLKIIHGYNWLKTFNLMSVSWNVSWLATQDERDFESYSSCLTLLSILV
jgi:hypothetical protein